MPKLKKRTITIYILILIILGFIIFVVPSITDAFTRTEVIEYKEMKVSDTVKGYMLRDETVYTASSTGSVKHFVSEGTLIKKGTNVLEVESKTVDGDESKEYADLLEKLGDKVVSAGNYVSKRKGILTYYIDGYEKYFSPSNIKKLNYHDTKKLESNIVNLKRESIKTGEPIFKICDNSKWYLVFWIEQEDITRYEVGNIVSVNLPKGQIEASVDNIVDQGERWLVILKTNRYYKGFTSERIVDAKVSTTDQKGLLIGNSSLTTKDKVVGVYVKTTADEFVFTPVQVIRSDGENSLVVSNVFYDKQGKLVETVKLYDEILKNPKEE